MKFFVIIFAIISFFHLSKIESLAQTVCEGSPAEDNRAGRKKLENGIIVAAYNFITTVKINLNMTVFLLKEKELAKLLKKYWVPMNLLVKSILVNLRTAIETDKVNSPCQMENILRVILKIII